MNTEMQHMCCLNNGECLVRLLFAGLQALDFRVCGGSVCVDWRGRRKGVSSVSRSLLPHCVRSLFAWALWALGVLRCLSPLPHHASRIVWQQEPHIERAHVDVERGRGGGQRETIEDEPADVILTEL